MRRGYAFADFSKSRSTLLPRLTALSIACCAFWLTCSAFSSSS
jgi:hypothetical protein